MRRATGRNTGISDNAPFYVFNATGEKGFVIISGDDCAKKILGYSDYGSFDFDNLPPQLDDILAKYTERLSSLTDGTPIHPSWAASAHSEPYEKSVLLQTAEWGQGTPYNSQCPLIDGIQAPTGCVATAMAIVMKYHNWPQYTSSELYSDYYNSDMSFDYSNGALDWNNTNDPENKFFNSAVSNIAKAAGVCIDTQYGKEESAAYTFLAAHELAYRFGYSVNCQALKSKY